MASLGAVLYSIGEDVVLAEVCATWECLGDRTNNFAELAAVHTCLKYIAAKHCDTSSCIYIESDSRVIVDIVLGTAMCHTDALVPLLVECRRLLLMLQRQGFQIVIRDISRVYNARADQLAKHGALMLSSRLWIDEGD